MHARQEMWLVVVVVMTLMVVVAAGSGGGDTTTNWLGEEGGTREGKGELGRGREG
jgi:hypothetical protein